MRMRILLIMMIMPCIALLLLCILLKRGSATLTKTFWRPSIDGRGEYVQPPIFRCFEQLPGTLREPASKTARQPDSETARQTDIQTDTQTSRHTHTHCGVMVSRICEWYYCPRLLSWVAFQRKHTEIYRCDAVKSAQWKQWIPQHRKSKLWKTVRIPKNL